MYSSACQYAVRALIYLASQKGYRLVLARDIAAAENIPKQFLSKILYDLSKKGLVQTAKGPRGGYALGKPARRIKLYDVIEAIDGPMDLSKQCVLGLDTCSDHAPCALHEPWKQFREGYTSTVRGLTISDMAKTLELKRGPMKRNR
jgi:Rrf2 family protein